MDYPPAFKPDATNECWCATCLKAAIQNAPLIEGVDYVVEDGLWVLSEYVHLKRGYCCGNSCRNCPYDYINVKFNA